MNKLVQQIVNEIKLQIFNEQDLGDKTIIALYPGRFQPMGRHHKAAYDWLANQFGDKNTYIVTSDKTDQQKSPFNFQEKKKIINKYGIKNVVKVRSPYFPTELLQKFDPEKTVIIYMIGEKDAGRLYGYKRLMRYNKTTAVPYKDINNPYAYYVYAPHVSFQIPDFGEMSGTNIRKALGDREAKLAQLKQRFTSIMGWFDASIFNLVISKLNERRGKIKEHVDDWFRSLLNMSDIQQDMFFDIIKKEYGDTKDLRPIIQKYMTGKELTPDEKRKFSVQMKDLMKLIGLGAIAAIPIPGTMLLIPVIVQLANKFGINLLPEVTETQKSEELPIVKREFWDKVFEEVANENYEFVICQECGEKMKQIQYRHLKYKHNMTLNEYIEKYPDSILVSESSKNYGIKNPMNKPGVREKHLKSMNDPYLKKLFSENSKNRIVTDETRLKCSINNSMKDPINRKKVSDALKETYSTNQELIEKRRENFKQIRNSDEYKNRMVELGYWRNEKDVPEYEKYKTEVRILTENNYRKYFYEIPNAKKRSREYHLDHKISINFGFNNKISPEIISHHSNLEVIHHSINESKFVNNSITPYELYELINNSSNKIDARQLLTCGGVAGHMTHPFEDMDLTFGDLKQMITTGLSGQITVEGSPTEKLDGQNLFVTFKQGKLYAARNKTDIKNGGMDYHAIKTKFSGRGAIEESFTKAFEDLESAIQSLTDRQQKRIFGDGSIWMNLEIVYPKSANVIDYDGAFIVFHGSTEYSPSGEKIEDRPENARILGGMIKQVNTDTQSSFNIRQPKKIVVKKSKNFAKKRGYFINEITKLQRQMKCTDNDTLGTWHIRKWKQFIKSTVSGIGGQIDKISTEGLAKRWAFFDKKFALNSTNIPDTTTLSWAKSFDKSESVEKMKEIMRPFEFLILRFGAEVLKNVMDVMSLDPSKTSQKIKNDVKIAIDKLTTSNNPYDIKVLQTQLKRIEAAGGIESIVPLEGIVFKFGGKIYKLTGAFAPINQLLGYFRYG